MQNKFLKDRIHKISEMQEVNLDISSVYNLFHFLSVKHGILI